MKNFQEINSLRHCNMIHLNIYEPLTDYIYRTLADRNWRKKDYKITTLEGHTNSVSAVALLGDKILSSSWDKTLKLWDWQNNQCVKTFVGHSADVQCLQTDGNVIVSGGSDTLLKVVNRKFYKPHIMEVWNVQSALELHSYRAHKATVKGLHFQHYHLASCSEDKTVNLWYSMTLMSVE